MRAKFINEEYDSRGSFKTYIDAPRWTKVPKFLRDLAFNLDLKIDIEVDKSLLRERTYFTVYGLVSKLEEFREVLEDSIKNYNKK
jgi:hypothetical protein